MTLWIQYYRHLGLLYELHIWRWRLSNNTKPRRHHDIDKSQLVSFDLVGKLLNSFITFATFRIYKIYVLPLTH